MWQCLRDPVSKVTGWGGGTPNPFFAIFYGDLDRFADPQSPKSALNPSKIRISLGISASKGDVGKTAPGWAGGGGGGTSFVNSMDFNGDLGLKGRRDGPNPEENRQKNGGSPPTSP